jgi:ACS family tartrate transporter-like MFS transporter
VAISQHTNPIQSYDVAADQVPALERETMRKVSRRLLPLLFLLYIASYLDRTNVGIAALQMNKAIGLSAAAYGLGAGIFFIGYALFEVPSNIILARVGARRWIARIAISWGLISCGMLLARGPLSFYALRFLLGVAEAGYFPGIIYYMSHWFPQRHRARAISRFMIGIPLSSMIGGPLGGTLLGLDGKLGLAGWQWLFLVEGLPAVILGVFVWRTLLERPTDARWLSTQERDWLTSELSSDTTRAGGHRGVMATFRYPMVWLIAIPYFVILFSQLGINFYLPTIMKESLHISNQRVGWITGIISACGMVGMLVNGWWSDHSGDRVMHIIVPLLIAMTGALVAATTHEPVVVVVGMAMVIFGHNCMMPAFWCLPSLFLSGVGAAAGIALINSLGNLGGFFGPNLLGSVKTEFGTYSAAFFVIAAVAFIAALVALRVRATREMAASPVR